MGEEKEEKGIKLLLKKSFTKKTAFNYQI